MRSTFKHLFYINRNKTKKNGLCPVMGRITLDGGISQFSTGLETSPELWDAKAGLSNGKNLHELKVNRELNELSKAMENHYAQSPAFLCLYYYEDCSPIFRKSEMGKIIE